MEENKLTQLQDITVKILNDEIKDFNKQKEILQRRIKVTEEGSELLYEYLRRIECVEKSIEFNKKRIANICRMAGVKNIYA